MKHNSLSKDGIVSKMMAFCKLPICVTILSFRAILMYVKYYALCQSFVMQLKIEFQ